MRPRSPRLDSRRRRAIAAAISLSVLAAGAATIVAPVRARAGAGPLVPRQAKRAQRVVEAVAKVVFLNAESQSDGSVRMTLGDASFSKRLSAGYDGEPSQVTYRVYSDANQATAARQQPDFGLGFSDNADREDRSGVIPNDTLTLLTQKVPDVEMLMDAKRYLYVKVIAIFRWNTINVEVIAERNSSTARDRNPIDPADAQAKIKQEFDDFKKPMTDSVAALSKQIYLTLDQTQQRLDASPALSLSGTALVAGTGTENEIKWTPAPTRLPVSLDDTTKMPPLTLDPIAGVSSSGPKDAVVSGDYSANIANSGAFGGSGLKVEEVAFRQAATVEGDGPLLANPVHRLAESLEWRNYRVFFEDSVGKRISPDTPVSLSSLDCTDLYRITQDGVRTRDEKRFAWALVAVYYPQLVSPPTPIGDVKYLLEVTQMFLFSAPAYDQEPSGHALVIKAYPLLTVKVVPLNDKGPVPKPSFAADLKMVFAPRLTRDDQHRPMLHPNGATSATGYFPDSRRDTNVPTVLADTNDTARPALGVVGQLAGLLAPAPPYWDFAFDYAEPDIQKAMAFDAVIYPRGLTNTAPFVVEWPGANYHFPGILPDAIVAGLHKGQLDMRRLPGQGEFDNFHLHPYIGFDDPSNADAIDDSSRAMIEAPAAADEVIHMHWRWGLQIPEAATKVDPDDFRGYSDYTNGSAPHFENGAPLIPPNQSLRIAIGRPSETMPVDPVPSPAPNLDPRQTAVWYRSTVHQATFGEASQFCVHGLGIAFHLDRVGPATNSDMLGAPFVVPGYHNFRWTNVPMPGTANVQRVPTASEMPGLQRNRLIKGQAPDSAIVR